MDYTVQAVEVLNNGEKDQNGNTAFNVKFEEKDKGVFMLAQKPPVVDGKEFGQIQEKTAKSGKTYERFYRQQRDQQLPINPSYSLKQDLDKQESIQRMNALNNATSLFVGVGHPNENQAAILVTADKFLKWLNGGVAEVSDVPDLSDILGD